MLCSIMYVCYVKFYVIVGHFNLWYKSRDVLPVICKHVSRKLQGNEIAWFLGEPLEVFPVIDGSVNNVTKVSVSHSRTLVITA